MTNITLRQITPSDLDFLQTMKKDQSVTERLAVNEKDTTIATLNGVQIGFVKALEYDKGIYELQYAVSEGFRGCGYGCKMISIATENLFAHPAICKRIVMVIKSDNTFSETIAIKNGYTIDYTMTEKLLENKELTDGFVYVRDNPYVFEDKRHI